MDCFPYGDMGREVKQVGVDVLVEQSAYAVPAPPPDAEVGDSVGVGAAAVEATTAEEEPQSHDKL